MSIKLEIDRLWIPKPTQDKFLSAIVQAPDMGMVAYLGSLGSGKTWALCRAAFGLAHAHPGIKILLGRFHGTDLRDTTQNEFFKLVADVEESLAAQWKTRHPEDPPPTIGHHEVTDRIYRFRNGSTILFRPLDEAEQKYKSLEIGCFGIDEASEVPETAVMMLLARCRQKDVPHVGFIVSNPTSYTHWMYKWFVKDKNPKNVLFRTNTSENLDNLPPGYVDRLREQYPPDWVRRYLEGEWGGLDSERPVFPSFDPLLHVKPLAYMPSRVVHVGIDSGFQSPGVIWSQVDKDGRLHIHRTWRPREIHAAKLAEGIVLRNQEWFKGAEFKYYAGVDINAKKDTGDKTAREIFALHGLAVSARYKSIDRGLTTIRNLLDTRDDGKPALFVDPYNSTLIEGFMGGYYYPADKSFTMTGHQTLVKDTPKKTGIYDPLMDALRYTVIHLFQPSGDAPNHGRFYPFQRRRPA